MPKHVLRASQDFEHHFAQVRTELDVPQTFPDAVISESEEAVAAFAKTNTTRVDATHLDFIAIDPPGAKDLDQALAIEKLVKSGSEDSYVLYYAIADVGAFVKAGGAIDTEARKRGTTLYSPDLRTPLHPPLISENEASLLAGTTKPALLWTIMLDGEAKPTSWRLERATVKIAEAITYSEAHTRIEAQSHQTTNLLAEIGRLRQTQEQLRGGVSLNLPSQEIVETNGHYSLVYDQTLPVENWNAQISLLTGMLAAETMLEAGVGIVRTLPSPAKRDVRDLRKVAAGLNLDWDGELSYQDFTRTVKPDTAVENAFLHQAAKTLRGASYQSFGHLNDGAAPTDPEMLLTHGAIASPYSHVTAPLRRLVDRFANEILLTIFADGETPNWAVEALAELPELMQQASQRDSSLERAMVDLTEVLILGDCVGKTFEASVVRVNPKRSSVSVHVAEPAVVSTVKPVDLSQVSLGDTIRIKLAGVDIANRSTSWDIQ